MTYPIYTPLRGGGNLSFGGDEFIFVEVSPEMDIEQALCIQALAKNIAAMDAPGIIDICPSHASYMLRFDPEVLDLDAFLPALEHAHEQALSAGAPTLSTEIVDIPVYYNDPWTRETLMRFRDRHQDPDSVDIEYVARVNGYEGIQGLIDAHSDNPFLATFPNFTPGNAECVQLAPRELQIQAPKYERPRTDTPSRALGHGGNCSNIYPSAGAGGFQLLGRSPVEILDMSQTHPDYAESPVLFRAGTVISFRQIDQDEYFEIRSAMENGTYRIRRAPIEFSVERHLADWRAYNLELKEALR